MRRLPNLLILALSVAVVATFNARTINDKSLSNHPISFIFAEPWLGGRILMRNDGGLP